MIEIRITDLENMTQSEYAKLTDILARCIKSDDKGVLRDQTGAVVTPINADDNPAMGAPDVFDAKEAFGNTQSALDPAAAFGPNLTGGAPSIAGAATSTTAPATPLIPTATSSATLPVPNTVLVPPVPNAAPAVPTVALVPPTLARIDKAGLPWDNRIHSETRAINKDGTWRNKRGVDVALVQQVEVELRHVQGLPTPSSPMEAFGSPNVVVGATAPSTANDAPIVSYLSLVQKVTAARTAGKLTDEEVKAACSAVGIPNGAFPLLVTKPELVPSVNAQINAFIAARG